MGVRCDPTPPISCQSLLELQARWQPEELRCETTSASDSSPGLMPSEARVARSLLGAPPTLILRFFCGMLSAFDRRRRAYPTVAPSWSTTRVIDGTSGVPCSKSPTKVTGTAVLSRNARAHMTAAGSSSAVKSPSCTQRATAGLMTYSQTSACVLKPSGAALATNMISSANRSLLG